MADVFGDWKEVRPLQREMMEAIMGYPGHLILTVRSIMGYAMSEYKQGDRKRTSVQKVGMGPQFDKDIEYEMHVSLSLDQEHRLSTAKARSTVLAGRIYQPNKQRDFADAYHEWLQGGTELIDPADVAWLRESMTRIQDRDEANRLRQEFKSEFGPPDQVAAEDFERVKAWMEANIPAREAPAPEPEPEPEPQKPARRPTPRGAKATLLKKVEAGILGFDPEEVEKFNAALMLEGLPTERFDRCSTEDLQKVSALLDSVQ